MILPVVKEVCVRLDPDRALDVAVVLQAGPVPNGEKPSIGHRVVSFLQVSQAAMNLIPPSRYMYMGACRRKRCLHVQRGYDHDRTFLATKGLKPPP
jgi:hypothetical protein